MPTTALPFLGIYTLLTVTLGWTDYKTGLLPDRFTCPLLWCGLLFSVACFPDNLADCVLGSAAGYGCFALLYWAWWGITGKEGLGYGDIKYIAALGAWHSWQLLPALALIACGLALIFTSVRVLTSGRYQAIKNPLRFGPCLCAAGFIVGSQQWFNLLL